MERLITLSSISAVTVASMLLALLIEVALLKAIFHFMSRMTAEPAPGPSRPETRSRVLSRSVLRDVRNAGL
ncbi:MAG TPA: hypothetical protein VD837_10605 [Terriglobales bacterium]|nr:hypothetical protein [Terriglobales bacterium]